MLRKSDRIFGFYAVASVVFATALVCPGQLRNAKIGDQMPEFELVDIDGKTFSYQDSGRVLVVVFMPHLKQKFEETAESIVKADERLESAGATYDIVGVVSGTSGKEFAESLSNEARGLVRLLVDEKYALWGELGVIATPTTVVAGSDGKIEWVKAGYGYDFAPALEERISEALGLAKKKDPAQSTSVKVVANSTTTAKVRRHLQMAKILEGRGRFAAAIAEMKKALELDPNSFQVAVELGEFLCRTGRNKAALELAERIEASSPSQKAAVLMIKGWAGRQSGDAAAAEKLLLESAKLDGGNSRVFFELGKIYEADGENTKAMAAYRRALEIVFGEIPKNGNSQKQ